MSENAFPETIKNNRLMEIWLVMFHDVTNSQTNNCSIEVYREKLFYSIDVPIVLYVCKLRTIEHFRFCDFHKTAFVNFIASESESCFSLVLR